MTKFSDQLFTDLISEYGPAVELPRRSARRGVPRPVWLAAGVVGMAGAVMAGVMVIGGSPAYAVTQHGDGTVTIAINQLSGVEGANSALRAMGDPVVVVPVRPGCPDIAALPVAHGHQPIQVSARGSSGSLTVTARGVPAGDRVMVVASALPHGTRLSARLISGPAPTCVSGEPTQPPAGQGSGQGSGSGVVSGNAGSGLNNTTGH